MKMPGAFWRNCAVLWAICFFNLLPSAHARQSGNGSGNQAPAQQAGSSATTNAPAQSPGNAATNQPPAANVITNQSFDQELTTNSAFLPPEPAPIFGAQPVPNDFEAQINTPASAGPSYLGGGQAASPITGTGVFGAPGFAPATGEGIYHAGLLNVHAGLSYTFLYGTGIEDQPGQKTSAVAQVVTPFVQMDLGQHLTVSYSPMATYYSGGSGLGNTTGEIANLLWSEFYEDWAFRVSQSYTYTSTPLIETGTQTAESDYLTGINVSHQIGNGFSFTLGLNQDIRDASAFNNLDQWSANTSINYMLTPKVQLAFSVGGGLEAVSDSPNVTFEDYSLVLMARPGPKTTINLSVGIEDQTFDASGVPSSVTPIYAASIRYQLFRGTSLIVEGGRMVSPSFFSNLLSTATSVNVALRQSLSPKLAAQVFGSYANYSYQQIEAGPLPKYFLGETTTSPLEVTRNDDTSSIGAGLYYTFTKRLFGSLYYAYSKNTGSQGGFNFNSSQVVFQMGYRY
jgi:hypothetical protein